MKIKTEERYDSGCRGDKLIAYYGICTCCGNDQYVFRYFARDPEVIEDMMNKEDFLERDEDSCPSCAPLKFITGTIKWKGKLSLSRANYLLARKIGGSIDIDFEKAYNEVNENKKMDKAVTERENYVDEKIKEAMKGKKVFTLPK